MKKPTNLPSTPGVYFFKNELGQIIYIGKAKSLHDRVRSYFLKNLGTKTAQMVSEAQNLSFIRVDSEVEALLLEASQIRKHLPKYNFALRDDKSDLYIGITKELYPRILGVRKTSLSEYSFKRTFGPFAHSRAAKSLLRRLRKIFPYSDHKVGLRGCINSQIGLCNPCPSIIANEKDPRIQEKLRKSYIRNIRNLTLTLSGNTKAVMVKLEKERNKLVEEEKFEEANTVQRELRGLEYLTAPPRDTREYLENPNLIEDIRERELIALKKLLGKLIEIDSVYRIECFDIAHLAGTHPTASMVTFINGEPDKTLYRHFKIRSEKKSNDFASMSEVLIRRKKHFETWGKPNLLVVDGGRPQVSAANQILGNSVPIIGLAKRHERVYILKEGSVVTVTPQGPALHLLQRLRDEAHRFARRYHHKLVKKSLI